jgi:transcription-repair coupling factor (superfamily II helicase)
VPGRRVQQPAAQDRAAHRGRPHRHAQRRRQGHQQAHAQQRRNAVDPLQLKAGDVVVHEQHGVGRYVEMVQRTVQGATREYLILEYAPSKRGQPGDRVFVPTDQLDLVTRYVGGEAPSLDKLGGSDWAKRKGRAKKAVKEIAAGSSSSTARDGRARPRLRPGHALAARARGRLPLRRDARPARGGQRGQGRHGEVVADGPRHHGRRRLRQDRDRRRAAFKAVQDGKQVAVLVPTTLLVQQHYGTFRDRFAQFP